MVYQTQPFLHIQCANAGDYGAKRGRGDQRRVGLPFYRMRGMMGQ